MISKNKVSQYMTIFPDKFCGYVCTLCDCICLKVMNFFHDFITFNLRETKRQTWVTIVLCFNCARVEPIFYNCFHQSISYVVTVLGKPSSCYGISASGLLSFSTILPSSNRVIFSLKTTFYDNKGLATPPRFLIITQLSFTFSKMCNT